MEVENVNNRDGNAMGTQDRFNHVIMPSLKHMSTVCIVSTIYKRQSTLEIIQQNGNEDRKLPQIVRYLYQNLSLLTLPKSIVEKSLSACKIVASEGHRALGLTQISSDYERRCRCGFKFSIPVEYFNCICFKMDGTVDMVKTFFSIMNETDYPNSKIFIAASHLCSQTLTTQSWEKLFSHLHPYEHFSVCSQLCKTYEFQNCLLNKYWLVIRSFSYYGYDFIPLDIVDSQPVLRTLEHLLEFSRFYLNPYASVYFFRVLCDEQKSSIVDPERFINKVLGHAGYTRETFNQSLPNVNIALFFLSTISERDLQIKVLRKHLPKLIILFISNLQYQNLLEPVITFVLHSLNQNDFNSVCLSILKLVENGCLRAKEIFFDLWNKSSNEIFKKSFIDYYFEHFGWMIVLRKILFNYFDIVKLMLAECTDEEKANYLQFLFEGKFYFNHIKDINCLNVIDNLINGIFSSESEITRFKKFVVRDESFQDSFYELIPEFRDSANKLLDWAFTSQSDIDVFKQDFDFISDFVKRALLTCEYEKADQLLNWSFNSNTEIIWQYKHTFIFTFYGRFQCDEWELFLNLVNWCFEKKDGKKSFKNFMSKFENLEVELWRFIFDDFEYINDLLSWCLTAKKIKKLKNYKFDGNIENSL